MTRRSRSWRSEDGSILPLVTGFGVLALAVILVAVAATSLYLERKRLFTLADGAALVGAEAFDLSAVRVGPGAPRPRLDPAAVRAAVSGYLADAPTSGLASLRLEAATTLDGRSATVTLSSLWRPPVVTLFFPEGWRLETTAVARSVFE